VIPVGGKPGRPRRLVVPVAPILELLGIAEPRPVATQARGPQ